VRPIEFYRRATNVAMRTSAARQSRAAVVAALRAAGCVFAEDEARLLIDAAGTMDELAAMVARRAGGLPLEHVLGWAQFWGLRIVVEPGVFVPRRRSEFLVRQAAVLARRRETADRSPVVVVDLCCGSGAVGAALVADLSRSSCMPSISIRQPCAVLGVTSHQARGCTRATSTSRCRWAFAAG